MKKKIITLLALSTMLFSCGQSDIVVKKCNVNLILEDGVTLVDSVTTSIEYDLRSEVDVDKLPSASKVGYTFIGWSIDKDEIIDDFKIKKDTSLYPIFNATNYSITYNTNGGINNFANPSTYTIESKEIVFKDASKDGYTFGGWYLDSEFKNVITSIPSGTHQDFTLYAKRNVITYNISYDLNGGKVDVDNPSTYTIETDTITLNDASKKGYTFKGWSNGKDIVTTIKKGSYGNIALIATYEVIEYTITYDLDDGVNNKDNPTKYTIETDTITLKDPTKDGYNFMGWINEHTTVTSIKKGSTGNITLTALWVSK